MTHCSHTNCPPEEPCQHESVEVLPMAPPTFGPALAGALAEWQEHEHARRRAAEAALAQERAAHDRTAEALAALEQKLAIMEGPLNDCIFMSGIHGAPYSGPTWEQERAAAREALAAYEARRKP